MGSALSQPLDAADRPPNPRLALLHLPKADDSCAEPGPSFKENPDHFLFAAGVLANEHPEHERVLLRGDVVAEEVAQAETVLVH